MCTDCKSEQGWKKCSKNWHGDYPAAHEENHSGGVVRMHCTSPLLRDAMLRASRNAQKEATQADTCALWEDQHQISLFLKNCTTQRGPTLEQFPKNCIPLETDNLSSSSCIIPWKEPYTAAGEQCREEGAVIGMMNWLGTCHSLASLHHSQQRNSRVRNEGVKVEPVKKWKMGKGVFLFLTMLLKVAVNPLKPTLFCLWC